MKKRYFSKNVMFKLPISLLLIFVLSLGMLNDSILAADITSKAVSSITSGKKLVSMMGAGWNLGNALDAYSKEMGVTYDTETLFGNPVTAKQMIDKVKKAGFKTVRIPVTYYNHMDHDYNIDENWLNRVEEVVNYVLEDNMFCIIDLHHDTGSSGWLRADYSKVKKSTSSLNKIWTQIAKRFQNYDNRLIFEGYNEILNSSNKWSWAGQGSYEAANQLNQAFVNAVRETGGRNKKRFLLVNTYAASVEDEVISHFVMPEDTVKNHIIVGVHSFIGKSGVKSMFGRLNQYFVRKGIPVMIAEFASPKNDGTKARVQYAKMYVTYAKKYKISYLWWDDGNYNSSKKDVCNYALLNRNSLQWEYPEIVTELVK